MGQEEFKKEVVPLRGKLISYAMQLIDNRDEAEDIIQEVLLKLWYLRERLPEYDSITALAIQITKHLTLNRLKFLERIAYVPDSFDMVAEMPGPYMVLEQKDQVEKVMLIIEQLPGLQQTILRMKHIDGFEIEEIAEITGSKPDAIRMNLSRARKKVKEHFLKLQR